MNLDCKRCGLLCRSTVSALKCRDWEYWHKSPVEIQIKCLTNTSLGFLKVFVNCRVLIFYIVYNSKGSLLPWSPVSQCVLIRHFHTEVSIHFIMPVHLSVRKLSAYLPLDTLPWNLILGTFMKICQEFLNLVKIKQKYWAPNMKT